MKSCPTPEQLRFWLAGQLSDAESSAVDGHVEHCAEVCQPLLDGMSGFEDEPDEEALSQSMRDQATVPVNRSHGTRPEVAGSSAAPHLRTFGRFEIIALVAKGAFGAVYRARDPQLDREVALKLPRKGLLQSQEERTRFLREARAAASLQHPNICPVYEAGELDGRQFIAMALIEGQSLAKIIGRGRPVAQRAAAATVRKLALALDEAHRHGIIHRDLKPTNIMIDGRGEPVVMDFGLARRYDPDEATLTRSGALLGTPAYMAPEQAQSRLDAIGPATDVYALGIVLYEMLTTRRPFEGDVAAVLAQIADVEPRPPSVLCPGLDPRLEAICLQAIAKNASDRYHSMRELAVALQEYLKATAPAQTGNVPSLDTLEIAALMTGLDTKVSDIAKGQHAPWWKWTAASVAAATVVLLGWALVPRSPTNITVHIGIDPALLADTSLSFFLDDREISAEQAAGAIEVPPGDHDLIVKRAQALIKHYRFHVSRMPATSGTGATQAGPAGPVVVLTEVPVSTEMIVEVPAPAAHWGFDDDGERAWIDAAGTTAPAREQGKVRRRHGVVGPAAVFSNPGDAIVVSDHPRLHGNASMTLAAWVCPKSTNAGRIAGKWSGTRAYLLNWEGGFYSFQVAFAVGGPEGTAVATQSFGAVGEWAHVVGVFDGQQLRLYIDGQLTSSQPLKRSQRLRETDDFARTGRIPTALQDSNQPFMLAGDGFQGLIDDVRVWDSALSAEQVTRLFDTYGRTGFPDDANLKVLVPAYFYPAAEGLKEWERMIAASSSVSLVAIANPSSGPGNAVDPNYTDVIRRSMQAGVVVVGYVSTAFGQRPTAEVTADIDRWLRFYPDIRGFFLDEQASGADQVAHYGQLYAYAKQKLPEGIVVANPGVACDRAYFDRPAADVICVFDNKTGFDGFQRPPDLTETAGARLAALLYDVADVAQMQKSLEGAAVRGVAYVYITDDSGTNPWDRLPSYWEAEVAAIHED